MNDRYALGAFWVGAACIVAGGLVAALSTPLRLELGPWVAAYLVLVCGVSTCLFAVARDRLTPRSGGRRFWIAFGCWNAGNAAVIAGTLLGLPLVVDVGGALLVVALVLHLAQGRNARAAHRRLLMLYRLVIVVLLVSIPVGLVLAATAPRGA